MRIEYLEEFVDLAATLSFTETAERLAVSEPSLSRHIKSLEEEIGETLFERTSRRVKLSAEGDRLLPYARAVVEQWDDYRAGLRLTRAAQRSAVGIVTNYYIADLVAQFCASHPDIRVRPATERAVSSHVASILERGEAHFVVATDPVGLPDHVSRLVLAHDAYVVGLPRGHRLAGKKAISASDLADEPFISFPPGSDGDQRLKEVCRAAGFEPRVIFSADVGSSIAQFVRDGIGVTLVRRETIAKMHTEGVAYVELDPPERIEVLLCWDGRRPLAAAARTFLDSVTEMVTAS
ncbi:LysR family transcriptional regulator [Demequina sp. NBRC 110051]|uniref:LysR family transcriptional regulator n=1 Tax=Demequina sp. NBRC 110051 TaxID=1570340 RepID=UPI0011806C7E|nr:LysR family transcriptional regulator [Demequina sp. NBRC 110051]